MKSFVRKTKETKRFFSYNSTSIKPAQSLEKLIKKLFFYSSFGTFGLIVYKNSGANTIEIVCDPTEENVEIIENLRDLRRKKFKSTAIFPTRFFEIFYGNFIDNREYVEYETEIIDTEDNENLAISKLIRLVLFAFKE